MEWEGEGLLEGINDGILSVKQGQLREENIETFHPIDILGGLWKGHSIFGKDMGAIKVGHVGEGVSGRQTSSFWQWICLETKLVLSVISFLVSNFDRSYEV